MVRLNNPLESSIYDIILKYGFIHNKGMKNLGQNFLCDENLLDKIANSAIPIGKDTVVVEIGPGPCGLTRSLLKVFPANKIVCIEKDIRFKPLHDEVLRYSSNLEFVYADALKCDLDFKKMAIIANLPYNIGTLLLIKWLTRYINNIKKMVLLFQKEVAERICAEVGTKQYGTVSVLAQLLCNVELLFNISSKAFIPSPKVTSSAVLLSTKNTDHKNELEEFARFVNRCFQFRRKVIKSTLKKLYPSIDFNELLLKLDIDGLSRPEVITPEKFFQLYAEIKRRGNTSPSSVL